MEDAENSLPPSKKRSAGRELTRDTPIDDDEEDTTELETGTFKKASDEVLATRRIVKVRRQPQTSSAPSSNPFATIRLVTPTESSANPSEAMPTNQAQLASENTTADDTNGITKDSEKAEDGNTEQSETKDSEKAKDEVEDKSAEESTEKENTAEKESGTEKSEVDKEQSNDDNSNKNEDKHVAEKGSAGEVDKEKIEHDSVTENNVKKENADKVESEEPSAEGSPLKSFQQLSSSQNAFTGLAGTGFSSSSFSFGSVSNDASALGNTSGSNFGTKSDKPFGLSLSNNGISLFGAAGSSAASKSEGSGFSTMPEVVVETGEENERAVFNADSILFEYVDGSWKERGKGELKINVTTIGSDKARLLMRSRGNYRLILNARLYPDMKLTNMEKKGVTFACINSATEGKNGLSTFALKFKDGSIVEEFKAAIMAHKGEASKGLKTPENSP